MVNLTKRANVYITDGSRIDEYFSVNLDNKALFVLIARAYTIGYKNFVIGISGAKKDKWLAMVEYGHIIVNWHIVRTLRVAEWNR